MHAANLIIAVCAVAAIGHRVTGQSPTAASLPADSLCANNECTTIISSGLTVTNNPTRFANYLTFVRGKPVKILSKSADNSVYGIEFQGQRGFAKAIHIREQSVRIPDGQLLKVPTRSIPWLQSKLPAQQANNPEAAAKAAAAAKPAAEDPPKSVDPVAAVASEPVQPDAKAASSQPTTAEPTETRTATTEVPETVAIDPKPLQPDVNAASTTTPAPTTTTTAPLTTAAPKPAVEPVSSNAESVPQLPETPERTAEVVKTVAPEVPIVQTAEVPKESGSVAQLPETDEQIAEDVKTVAQNHDAINKSSSAAAVEAAKVTDPTPTEQPETRQPVEEPIAVQKFVYTTTENEEPELQLVGANETYDHFVEIAGNETDNEEYETLSVGDDYPESDDVLTDSRENEVPKVEAIAEPIVAQNLESNATETSDSAGKSDTLPIVAPNVEVDATETINDLAGSFSSPPTGDSVIDVNLNNQTEHSNTEDDENEEENEIDDDDDSDDDYEDDLEDLENTVTEAIVIDAANTTESPEASAVFSDPDNSTEELVEPASPIQQLDVNPHVHDHQHHHQHHDHGHSHEHLHVNELPSAHNPPAANQLPLIHPGLVQERVPLQFDSSGRLIYPGRASIPPSPLETPESPTPAGAAAYLEPSAAAPLNTVLPEPVADVAAPPLGVGTVHEMIAPSASGESVVIVSPQPDASAAAAGIVDDVWGTISQWFGTNNAAAATDEPVDKNAAQTVHSNDEDVISIAIGGGSNEHCESLTGDSHCPSSPDQRHSPTATPVSSPAASIMQTATEELSFIAQLFAEHISLLAATIAYTTITGLIVLLLLFGQRFVSNRGREQALLSKLNIIERKLMTSGKECELLRAQLVEAKHKLQSIEDNSFGSNEMVASVRRELAVKTQRTAELQERVQALEAELDTATEAGLELNKMVSELLSNQSGSDSIISSVEEMQRQLNEQEEMTSAINALLAEKSRENSELHMQLAAVDGKYDTELADVVTLNERLAADSQRLQTELDELRTSSEAQSAELAAKSAAQLTAANAELETLRSTYETVRVANVSNESRVQVLEDLVKELRSGEIDVALMDATKQRTELLALAKEKDRLADKLEGESDARRLLEDHVRVVGEEMAALRQGFNAAEKDKLEAQTRLEVLSSYFKDKEMQLQKELSVKEALTMKQLGETTSTVERIRGLQSDIAELRSLNDSLKAEIEAQQAAHKAQISAAEARAHESWLAARQTQRRFEEAVGEAGALRRKLTSLSTSSAASALAVDGSLGALQTTLDGADGGLGAGGGAPSPIAHLDASAAALNPGAPSSLLLGVLPPPPFMPPPPLSLLPPLGYMPQPLPPLLPPGYQHHQPGAANGAIGGLPLPPLPLLPPGPPGEMRPPPLGRLMSPPPPLLGAGSQSGGRYSPPPSQHQRYHRNSGRYSPDDDAYAYDSDDGRHLARSGGGYDRRGGGRGDRGRSPPMYDDTETDFSPPLSPEPPLHRGNSYNQHHHRDSGASGGGGGGSGGGGRAHHNPARVGGGGRSQQLYSPPMSTKSDTTSRSKAGALSSGSIESLGSRKSHHGGSKA